MLEEVGSRERVDLSPEIWSGLKILVPRTEIFIGKMVRPWKFSPGHANWKQSVVHLILSLLFRALILLHFQKSIIIIIQKCYYSLYKNFKKTILRKLQAKSTATKKS